MSRIFKGNFQRMLLLLDVVYCALIWHDDMEVGSAWQSSEAYIENFNCYIGGCVELRGVDSFGAYIIRNTNTTNYHHIQLQYSILPDSLEQNDYCLVSYSIDETNWVVLHLYDRDDNGILFVNEIMNMSKNANNQNSISIKFEVISSCCNNDRCHVDEVYLLGTFGTANPTPAPTLDPTTIPTSIPSKYPTLIPTFTPSMIPTAPSNNPTKIPSNIPSSVPSLVPSSVPTLNPSIIPSNNPTTIPSDNPTSTPSNVPSLFPSVIPSNNPTKNPTTWKPSQSPIIITFDYGVVVSLQFEYTLKNVNASIENIIANLTEALMDQYVNKYGNCIELIEVENIDINKNTNTATITINIYICDEETENDLTADIDDNLQTDVIDITNDNSIDIDDIDVDVDRVNNILITTTIATQLTMMSMMNDDNIIDLLFKYYYFIIMLIVFLLCFLMGCIWFALKNRKLKKIIDIEEDKINMRRVVSTSMGIHDNIEMDAIATNIISKESDDEEDIYIEPKEEDIVSSPLGRMTVGSNNADMFANDNATNENIDHLIDDDGEEMYDNIQTRGVLVTPKTPA